MKTNNSLSFWKVCKMLWRWYEWREVKSEFSTMNLDKITHDSGYWYWSGLNCITLRKKDDYSKLYSVNGFLWPVFIFLCIRLERKLAKFNK